MFSNNTKDDTDDTINKAKEMVNSAKKDLKRKFSNVNDENFVDNISKSAHNIGVEARDAIDQTKDKISTASSIVVDEIRHNPIRASLISLGVGFLLGVLTRR